MPNLLSIRRLVCRSLAILFAALATTYCVLWVVHVRHARARPGFSDYEYSASTRSMTVGVVFPESPAEQAGLRPGDRIVAIDGQKLGSLRPFYESIIVGQKDTVELTAEDAISHGGVHQLKLVLPGGQSQPMRMTPLEHVLYLPMGISPWVS